MKRIVFSALVLFCLGSVTHGQQVSPSSLARRIAWEAAKRGWEIQTSQVAQAYRERQNERQRYDIALRREWEANYRADYAERTYPSSWFARDLRQAANQASMERARAQVAVQLRDQNDRRSIYGSGVTTVPTREQWIRQGQVNNRAIPAPRQERPVSDRERAANENRDRALDQMRDKSRQIERAVQSGRPTADLVREHKQAMDRYVEGVREASRSKREAAERNGSNDRTPRDSQPSRGSRDSAKESWQDQQRERADRRP